MRNDNCMKYLNVRVQIISVSLKQYCPLIRTKGSEQFVSQDETDLLRLLCGQTERRRTEGLYISVNRVLRRGRRSSFFFLCVLRSVLRAPIYRLEEVPIRSGRDCSKGCDPLTDRCARTAATVQFRSAKLAVLVQQAQVADVGPSNHETPRAPRPKAQSLTF